MHDTTTDRLSEYLDDELSPEERATVDAHLQTCAQCRSDLDALRGVMARAATLHDAAPESDLWPGVAARIDGTPVGRPRDAKRRFSFTLPQLVAAGLALMVLSGGLVWLARLGGPSTDFPPVAAGEPIAVNFADGAYDDAIADLQRTLDAARARLDSGTVRVLDENLAAVDHAIGECRKALEKDPANVYLKEYLSATRAKKLRLLREAASLVDGAR
jgi:hypothetical protein